MNKIDENNEFWVKWRNGSGTHLSKALPSALPLRLVHST